MIQQPERDVERPLKAATLEMPRQAPPIDRNGTTPGAHSDTTGVEADGLITSLISKFLPI
ncbi:hypothetical protein [Streptomyces sp. NPDC059008]|uniref:hypothetical protein n=1 Tax=unclassified Streptomyces TaxID=2593676 RepID=UPI0036902C20